MAFRPYSPRSGISCCTAKEAVSKLSRKPGCSPVCHGASILTVEHTFYQMPCPKQLRHCQGALDN